MRLYGEKGTLSIDGHQHIHMVPWIYEYIAMYNKFDIEEIRYPIEKIHLINFLDIFNLKYIRNFTGLIFLKFCSFFNKKRSNLEFYGMLYSDLYNETVFKNHVNKKSNKIKEILIHAGISEKSEKYLFTKKDFSYHTSRQRNIENSLAYIKLK